MKKKKINPRRIPATQGDVKKARKDAVNEAVVMAFAIALTVLRDKYGWTPEQLAEFWQWVNEISDSITKGFVTIKDLMKCLEDEAGIELK